MNQHGTKHDPRRATSLAAREWISSADASRQLGVKRATLYAYVSRGLVRAAPSDAGSRTRVYSREDIDRLVARSDARAGHGPAAAGALRWGQPVLETYISEIRPDGPRYRGQGALDLARAGASFEDVCTLLWGPSRLAEEGLERRPSDASDRAIRALLRRSAGAFDAMLIAASVATAAAPLAEPSVDVARAGSRALVRRLVAACGIPRGGDAAARSRRAPDLASAAVAALGGRADARDLALMNEALIVIADHELNPSTFAARVAASAGASLPACVMSAIAALSGPLHGSATARVEALLAEVGQPERAVKVVRERLGRGEVVPGFGHPAYPDGDPRAVHLLRRALASGRRSKAVRTAASLVEAMDLIAGQRPTLDVGLVALSSALGLPSGSALAIFACGRSAGWIAHALEQRAAGYILRPRARYVGSAVAP